MTICYQNEFEDGTKTRLIKCCVLSINNKMVTIWLIHYLKAMDSRRFFQKKKNEGKEAQARLEEVEEELSAVADHLEKSEVRGNEIMRTI